MDILSEEFAQRASAAWNRAKSPRTRLWSAVSRVKASTSSVLLIVGRKVGNALVVDNEEFHGHQASPPESAGGGPDGDPQ